MAGDRLKSRGEDADDARMRQTSRHLILVTTVALAVCVAELVGLPGIPEYRGFLAGGLSASAFWLVALRRHVLTHPTGAGVQGEALSRHLLDAVPEWLAVHELPLDGHVVDHVVVTPLAVLAVETAWWGPAGEEVHAERRAAAVERARRNARAVKNLLAGRDLGLALPVWPVVLTWGPGAEDTQVGLVDVVSGADAAAWTLAYRSGAISAAVGERAHAALLRHHPRSDARSGRQAAALAA